MSQNAQEEEFLTRLLENNDKFKQLSAVHRELKQRVVGLEAKPFLSEEEELEEQRLKKLKLHTKDVMAEMVSAARQTGQV